MRSVMRAAIVGLVAIGSVIGADSPSQGQQENPEYAKTTRYYHDASKPREFFFFLAEGLSKTVRHELGGEILALLADQEQTRAGDRLNFVLVPSHRVLARLEVPAGSVRARLHRPAVKKALRKLGKYIRNKETAGSTQCDAVRVAKSVFDLHALSGSACYVIIAADPLYTVKEDPSTEAEESSWNFENRLVPSIKCLEEGSGTPFSVGKTDMPPATVMTWFTPTARWSNTGHMAAVENFYKYLWLQQGGFLLRINGSVESCFDLVRPQKIVLPKKDRFTVAAMIDTQVDSVRLQPKPVPQKKIEVIEQYKVRLPDVPAPTAIEKKSPEPTPPKPSAQHILSPPKHSVKKREQYAKGGESLLLFVSVVSSLVQKGASAFVKACANSTSHQSVRPTEAPSRRQANKPILSLAQPPPADYPPATDIASSLPQPPVFQALELLPLPPDAIYYREEPAQPCPCSDYYRN